MAKLADQLTGFLHPQYEIIYLTASHAAMPPLRPDLTVVVHEGFQDYQQKVKELAPDCSAVIMGAAVVNLIPKKPFEGKFPSHNYQPGDTIPIDFEIAPRVISLVKEVAPKTMLFGFKLLQGVEREELIRAAYEVCLDSRCTAVFANDADDLQQIHAVTKERGIHSLKRDALADWINELLQDDYYATEFGHETSFAEEKAKFPRALETFEGLISKFRHQFTPVEEGYIFGTVALRLESYAAATRPSNNRSFLTTGRGKKELSSCILVRTVNHRTRRVWVAPSLSREKASLNAPLLHYLFTNNPKCHHIVHFHQAIPGLPYEPYAPPGTERDAMRSQLTSFNIHGHGCMLMFDEEGRQL